MSIHLRPQRAVTAALVAAPALLLTACGSLYQHYDEYLVRDQIHGSSNAPAWVQNQIQDEYGVLNFVGRGMAYNVLDERKAFDEAVMHAREQLAMYVRTRVTSQACDKDWARGARFLPIADAGPGDGETVGASLDFRAAQMADAFVGELLPVAQYWEQWDVEEAPRRKFSGIWFENDERFEMRRYKCWVLASIEKERVDAMVASALRSLEHEAQLQASDEMVAELALAHDTVEALTGYASDQRAEIMQLRERIHYGRPFRLTAVDNCVVPDPCVVLQRPDWRHTALEVVGHVPVVEEADCDPCNASAKAGH